MVNLLWMLKNVHIKWLSCSIEILRSFIVQTFHNWDKPIVSDHARSFENCKLVWYVIALVCTRLKPCCNYDHQFSFINHIFQSNLLTNFKSYIDLTDTARFANNKSNNCIGDANFSICRFIFSIKLFFLLSGIFFFYS